jgi:threonine dehydrogenase-like Zn-dependent dehydrogenase
MTFNPAGMDRRVPDPEILDEGDAIVRVDAVTICGTHLQLTVS